MTQAQSSPRLRMDRSRYFSTIHGQKDPRDPHLLAKYRQDGIHFDAQGLHLEALLDDESRALVARRLKRQIATAPKADTGADSGDDGDAGEPVNPSDINLELWLRGEADYPWFSITKLVRERFHSNITKKSEMVEFLVLDEKIVSQADLAPQFAELLKSKAA